MTLQAGHPHESPHSTPSQGSDASHSSESTQQSRPVWIPRFSDILELSKPRITRMVLVTTFIGFVMADRELYHAESIINTIRHHPALLLHTMIGTALSCMGASVLNQVYERDTDSLMHRTQKRPLPAGRAHSVTATILGLLFSIAGVALLGWKVNMLTAAISAFTIFSYVLMYTPMKRINSTSTLVGAVPGALPPVMGYTAVANDVGLIAGLLFGIMFVWQLPHFLAIAWLYRDEYARAGMPMLPVVDPDGSSTFRHMLLTTAVLLPLGLLPTLFGICGWYYFAGSLIVGLIFLALGIKLVITKTRKDARLVFFASLLYLPIVLGLMMFDQL